MTKNNILATVKSEMKSAMVARDKDRLNTIRLVLAEFKRIEVDERIEVSDERALTVLDRMLKQRKDSLGQYQDAQREDLAEKERFEINVIREFLPEPMTQDEIDALIAEAFDNIGESNIQAMGKIMNFLKPKTLGRVDIGLMSQLVRSKLMKE